MLKRIYIGLISLAIIFLCSCSDDDSDAVNGYVTLGGEKFPLYYATSYLRERGPGETLYSNELVISGEYGINFWIFLNSNSLELKNGTYPFTPNPTGLKNVISNCDITLGVDTDSYVSDPESEGNFVVSITGNTYTFDMDAVIDGHNFKMHYKGKIIKDSSF